MEFRQLIFEHQSFEKEKFVGTVEVDESFFGPTRGRGRPDPRKRGRGTLKQPVFGIYERNGRVYTEGIEAFWSFTKRRLTKFNGVKKNFELHLQECEWRYNKSTDQLVKELKSIISKNRNSMA